MSDTVPKPYWYDTLKQMHLNGPTEAGNINNKDALEELEYIVEVDGDEECVLTSKENQHLPSIKVGVLSLRDITFLKL